MECYDAATDTNCAGTGAIGVVAPLTVEWRYQVKLDSGSIKKAMWCEVSPNGKRLWSFSGDNLLVYRMSDISPAHAWPAHSAIKPLWVLRKAVPPSGVTGAAFYRGRLFLAGNEGNDHEVWSVDTRTGTRRLEISRELVGESEGLDVVKVFDGVLHWMIMPILSGTTPPTYKSATLLNFVPQSS